MAIKHPTVKAPGNTLAAIADWNANHTIDAGTILRSATLIVAASDSKDTTNADYFCDGVADDVQINAAIDSLPATGGCVMLMDGTFDIDASIEIDKSDISLVGQGSSTIITTSLDIDMIIDTAAVIGIYISNLQITGAGATNTSNNGINFGTTKESIITNCWINTCGNDGIQINSTSSGNITISSNIIFSNINAGIKLDDTDFISVVGNQCSLNKYGINVDDTGISSISENVCRNNSYNGIYLESGADYNSITGNSCYQNNRTGIYNYGGDENTISGNMCYRNGYQGIHIYGFNFNNTITGNMCYYNTRDGIKIENSSHNVISSNNCYENDSANTASYDGISLADTSIGNIIIGNRCRDNDRHEIGIRNAPVSKSLVVCNSCIGTNHVGTINDAGTDTMLIGNDEGDGFKFGDTTNYTNINRDGVMTFAGIAELQLRGTAVAAPASGSTYWDDANQQLYIYSTTTAAWEMVQLA